MDKKLFTESLIEAIELTEDRNISHIAKKKEMEATRRYDAARKKKKKIKRSYSLFDSEKEREKKEDREYAQIEKKDKARKDIYQASKEQYASKSAESDAEVYEYMKKWKGEQEEKRKAETRKGAISKLKLAGKGVAVAAVVGAVLYGAKKLYDKYKDNKEKAKATQRKALSSGLSKCSKTKDPNKCRAAIQKKISSLK